MFTSVWPEPHIAALKKRFADGQSFAQIAAAINAKFGTSYSRNSCIGKARRIGLTTDDRPKPRPKPKQRREPVAHFRPPSRQPQITREQLVIRCAEIVPRNISIYELSAQTCKWPFGHRAPYTFCGHPVFGCGPYCEAHQALGTSAGTRSEQAAHHVPGKVL